MSCHCEFVLLADWLQHGLFLAVSTRKDFLGLKTGLNVPSTRIPYNDQQGGDFTGFTQESDCIQAYEKITQLLT